MSGNIERRNEIDIARGIAIIAVVLHHIPQYFVRYKISAFPESLAVGIVRTVSYINMPTFMFIAGLVLSFTMPSLGNLRDYFNFEGKKFYRLILPFISVSLAQLLIKIFWEGTPLNKIGSYLSAMAIDPGNGPAPHLWFLYVLMLMFVICPLFSRIQYKKFVFLWILLFVLAVIPIDWSFGFGGSGLFCLTGMIWYLPVFTAGYWYGKSSFSNKSHSGTQLFFSFLVSVLSLPAYHLLPWPHEYVYDILKNIVHLSGHIACALFVLWTSEYIVRFCSVIRTSLNMFGHYSYDIYLLHVAFVAHPVMVLVSRLPVNRYTVSVVFVLVVAVTAVIPVILGRIIRKFGILSFLILGVKTKGQLNIKIPE